MIQVAKFIESLVTDRALFAFIPLRNNIPDQAVLGICLDLLQAFLTTISTLRPT